MFFGQLNDQRKNLAFLAIFAMLLSVVHMFCSKKNAMAYVDASWSFCCMPVSTRPSSALDSSFSEMLSSGGREKWKFYLTSFTFTPTLI